MLPLKEDLIEISVTNIVLLNYLSKLNLQKTQ